MATRSARQHEGSVCEPLAERIADLELRIKLVEGRLRQLASAQRSEGSPVEPARKGRPRARCPGCHLEIPVGRRGDNCIWCGFYFSAVEEKASK